jgi:hypothetical protein
MELETGERQDGKEEASDRANQSKEAEEEPEQRNEARTVDQLSTKTRGRWRTKQDSKR